MREKWKFPPWMYGGDGFDVGIRVYLYMNESYWKKIVCPVCVCL